MLRARKLGASPPPARDLPTGYFRAGDRCAVGLRDHPRGTQIRTRPEARSDHRLGAQPEIQSGSRLETAIGRRVRRRRGEPAAELRAGVVSRSGKMSELHLLRPGLGVERRRSLRAAFGNRSGVHCVFLQNKSVCGRGGRLLVRIAGCEPPGAVAGKPSEEHHSRPGEPLGPCVTLNNKRKRARSSVGRATHF